MSASTFSLAACDLERREWGVAVASRFLAVGALSAWAESDVGAVATQSWIKASYGTDGLRLMREGADARDALDTLLAADAGREQRQVGIVSANGRAAAYTGSACLPWAGERVGTGYAAQGNMLVSEATLGALVESFHSSGPAPLAERLIAALTAAQAAGGDRRGQQAAAVLVARRAGGYLGADIVVDLRVDDHPAPVEELTRLYALHQLYFGSTPEEEWLAVDEQLEAELGQRLDRLGYASGELGADLETWAGVENLEERVRGVGRIDPVVLAHLRGVDDER
jgi:uncharacterized Ntn-hydrolase superfamily protein